MDTWVKCRIQWYNFIDNAIIQTHICGQTHVSAHRSMPHKKNLKRDFLKHEKNFD